MAEQKNPPLTGRQKAAVLFIALGAESSALLFQHMNEEEIESVTLQIANQKKIPADQKKAVISEFYQMLMAKSYLSAGGLEYAQNILEKALGTEKAKLILSRLTASLQARPFDFLHKTDPSQLMNFIQNEHGLPRSRSGSDSHGISATRQAGGGHEAHRDDGSHVTGHYTRGGEGLGA